jgi:hypothetical protein
LRGFEGAAFASLLDDAMFAKDFSMLAVFSSSWWISMASTSLSYNQRQLRFDGVPDGISKIYRWPTAIWGEISIAQTRGS